MAGLGGVHEQRWCAGRGQGRGDFSPDMTALAHAHYDDAAAADQHRRHRAGETRTQARLGAEQRCGLDVQSLRGKAQRACGVE